MPPFVVQQTTEYRRRIKPWKTQPVYRAHAADQRRRMTVGHQSIVGDWEGTHCSAPVRCVLVSSRGASAFFGRGCPGRQADPVVFSERAYILRLHAPIGLLRDSNASKEQVSSRVRQQAGFGKRQCHRSEEHTSELQSLTNLLCRLLL